MQRKIGSYQFQVSGRDGDIVTIDVFRGDFTDLVVDGMHVFADRLRAAVAAGDEAWLAGRVTEEHMNRAEARAHRRF